MIYKKIIIALVCMCVMISSCSSIPVYDSVSSGLFEDMDAIVGFYVKVRSDIVRLREAGEIDDDTYSELVEVDREMTYVYENLSRFSPSGKKKDLLVILTGAVAVAKPFINQILKKEEDKKVFSFLVTLLEIRRSRMLQEGF